MTIQLRKRDFVMLKSGTKKMLPAESSDHSIASWITFSPAFFELNPNESRNLDITLNAPSGDYMARWGVIDVSPAKERSSLSADKNVETGLLLKGRVSVILTYNPSANSEINLKINNLKEVSSDKPGKRKFTAEVDNLGNRIASCESYLMASGLKNMEEKRFPPVSFTAYPKSTMRISYYLPDTLSPGEYSLAAILDYGSKSQLEGIQITINVKE